MIKMGIDKNQNYLSYYNEVIFRFFKFNYQEHVNSNGKAYYNGQHQVIKAEGQTLKKIELARNKVRIDNLGVIDSRPHDRR
jgi:hypothetical protein